MDKVTERLVIQYLEKIGELAKNGSDGEQEDREGELIYCNNCESILIQLEGLLRVLGLKAIE